jgi:hypothetical protein
VWIFVPASSSKASGILLVVIVLSRLGVQIICPFHKTVKILPDDYIFLADFQIGG